jgi:hypothetical protein
MLNVLDDGDLYVKNRKGMEKRLKKDLEEIEGFEVVSRSFQLKNPNKFAIPNGLDPGQMVMCKQNKARYIKLTKNSKKNLAPLSIQRIDVYDENGQNVSVTNNNNYINEYELTNGQCKSSAPMSDEREQLSRNYRGQITSNNCESLCNADTNCTGFEIKNELNSEGLNQCWTYNQPNIIGDDNTNFICRVKQRKEGTSKASSSGLAEQITDAYKPLTGKSQPWPNSFVSQLTDVPHEWEVDLGKEVNVKKIIVYVDIQTIESILGSQTADIKLYVLDKYHNTLVTKSLQNTVKQTIDINIPTSTCGGPVATRNMSDFDELKELQTTYNRQLQAYNQAVKDLIENSRGYISASNRNNNRFANTYLKDHTSGATGYVTDRGVWKHLPNPQMGNSIQGKNGCPANWASAESITVDDEQSSSIFNASEGEIIKMGGISIVKGTPTIANQSCSYAGQNVYITNPNKTSNRRYVECSQSSGSYQSDIGTTTIEACAKRAEDMGLNVFQMGPNNGGGRGNCYINGGGSPISNQLCPNVPGVGKMGVSSRGYWQRNGRYWWGGWKYKWVSGYNGFATYQTTGAGNSNLGKTFHITDDLNKKEYPSSMVSRDGDDFQLLPGYNSYGNDITSGSGLSIKQIKQKCIETPGAVGFYVNGNNYWIKNANMWPNGNRQYTGGDLYVRNTKVNNNNSCSKEVTFSQQSEIDGYVNAGFMNMSTTCGLGSISERDTQFVREQYNKLNALLDKIHKKILELSTEDVNLNEKLLSEYKLLKSRLNTYEDTYKEIRSGKNMILQTDAMAEDSNLQMLSYNQKYILWSMIALGVTAGTMKLMK